MPSLILYLTVIPLLFTSLVFSQEELSKEEIVQIAIREFEKRGGKLQERTIFYDAGNGRWEKKFATLNAGVADKFEILNDRDFQAVYFAIKPKPGLSGKDIWVFIDRATGQFLAMYTES